MSILKKKIDEIEDSQNPEMKKRLSALMSIQNKRGALVDEYRHELFELEKKYQALYSKLYSERFALVNGTEGSVSSQANDASADTNARGGIPGFWLQSLKNHPNFSHVITENDADALSYLKDIRLAYFDKTPGFKLEFEFADNPYFENEVLTKEYHLSFPADYFHEGFIYEYTKGCSINWKDTMNLCFKTILRTQRHRSNNSIRTVKREEIQDSFFHFFNPPTISDEEDSDEDIELIENQLQIDFELGEILKDYIIPNAIDWYTGAALEYTEFEDCDDSEDDTEGSLSSEPEDSLDSDAGDSHPEFNESSNKPECKQQ